MREGESSVAIVGGGIGGLAAALGRRLLQVGHASVNGRLCRGDL